MNEFNFTFIVLGIDINDDSVIERLFDAGCDDATFSLFKGQFGATFDRESSSYRDAVISAYNDLTSAGFSVSHFEPDYLVSQTEISVRAGVTRQAVSAWVSGERGEGFPKPTRRLETKSPLWDWVDVSSWLNQHSDLPAECVKQARISRAVNAFAQLGSDAFNGANIGVVVDKHVQQNQVAA